MSFANDLAGRRTRTTWSDGFFVTYDYDAAGQLTAIRESGAASGVGVLASYAYDGLGRRTGILRGNGVGSAIGYDAIGRLTNLSHDLAGTAHDVNWAYSQAAAALDATGQADDRKLADDVRGFLDKQQGMNATPEVFAVHHARMLATERDKAELPAPDRPPKDRGRSR